MTTIYDIGATELIEEAAKELKSVEAVKPPAWAIYVKTGHSKERPPAREDWWHVRTAAVLRKVYRFGPIGVSKLRGMYGSKKNCGSKSEHFYKGSGNVIRKILQQLEKAEFVRHGKVGIHKGRIITPKGKKFLDKVATKLKGARKEVKVEKEAKVEKKEAKQAEVKPKAEAPKVEKPKVEAKPAEKRPKKEALKREETKPKAEVKKEAKEKPAEKPKEEEPKAEEAPKVENPEPKEQKTE